VGSQSSYWWLVGIVILGAVVGALSYSGPRPPDGVVPPVVDAGDDTRALVGSDVRLMGTAYDSSGAEFSVVWTSTEGYENLLNSQELLRPVFHVPQICGDSTIEFTLTATNEYGAAASDSVLLYVCETSLGLPEERRTSEIPSQLGITVVPQNKESCQQTCVPINHAPYADAGSDITLREGETTRLTCTGSDPDGDAVTYWWDAEAGTLTDPTVLHPMYTAPSVDCGAPACVRLTLTVTDSCGASTSDDMIVTVTNQNHAPHADAGSDITLREGETARLTCTGSDPDGDAVTYWWDAEGGTFADPTVLHPMYTAPSVDCGAPACVRLTLTVTDSCGASTSDDMIVTVTNQNHAPYADAGSDITLREGETARLTCTGIDPDGDRVSYLWDAEAGTFADPTVLHPMYTAPSVDCGAPACVRLTLTVADSCGASTSDDMIVTVTNQNHAPHADAGSDITLREGETTRLTCTGSDPDGDAVTYWWDAEAGTLTDPTVLHPMYTAPSVDCGAPACVRLTLTVTDSCGASTSDDMIVTVTNQNHAPHADAGSDITLREGETARLTCTGSDPDGDAVTYWWDAEGGTFADPTVLHPMYTAPSVDCGAPACVRLTLTVTDSCGASTSDDMIVTVTNQNHAPYADAGSDITLREGETARLTCTGIDPDGDRVSYLWDAEAGTFADPTVLHPMYTAPSVDCGAPACVRLTLTVADSCGASTSDDMIVTVTNQNHAPYADAGSDITLREGETARLTCTGIDPDGDRVSYLWDAEAGTFADPTVLHPMYTAPFVDCGAPACVRLTLTVTDSCGASTSDDMMVTVTNENRAPIVSAGEDFAMSECLPILLSGTAFDPDGDIESVQWEIVCGGGHIDFPDQLDSIYLAPAVSSCLGSDVVLRLRAADACGATATDTVSIHIRDIDSVPSADAGPDVSACPGQRIQLSGMGYSLDGEAVSYRWTVHHAGGSFFENPSLPSPILVVSPDISEDRLITVTLTVSDSCGRSASDEASVHVRGFASGGE